jgi:hypothetical protein
VLVQLLVVATLLDVAALIAVRGLARAGRAPRGFGVFGRLMIGGSVVAAVFALRGMFAAIDAVEAREPVERAGRVAAGIDAATYAGVSAIVAPLVVLLLATGFALWRRRPAPIPAATAARHPG